MRLYTEEQLLKYVLEHGSIDIDVILLALTPLELPSNEDLEKELDIDKSDPYDLAYLGGAIRMRNKIQGGKK